jgi:hypothetical protein
MKLVLTRDLPVAGSNDPSPKFRQYDFEIETYKGTYGISIRKPLKMVENLGSLSVEALAIGEAWIKYSEAIRKKC